MDYNGNDLNQNNQNDPNNQFNQYEQPNYGQPSYDSIYGMPQPQKQGVGGMSIASLVLGIISVLTCCFGVGAVFGLVALIFGIVSLVKGRGKGLAIAGIVTGAIGLLFGGYMLFSYIAAISMYGGWDGFMEEVMRQAQLQQGM